MTTDGIMFPVKMIDHKSRKDDNFHHCVMSSATFFNTIALGHSYRRQMEPSPRPQALVSRLGVDLTFKD